MSLHGEIQHTVTEADNLNAGDKEYHSKISSRGIWTESIKLTKLEFSHITIAHVKHDMKSLTIASVWNFGFVSPDISSSSRAFDTMLVHWFSPDTGGSVPPTERLCHSLPRRAFFGSVTFIHFSILHTT